MPTLRHAAYPVYIASLPCSPAKKKEDLALAGSKGTPFLIRTSLPRLLVGLKHHEFVLWGVSTALRYTPPNSHHLRDRPITPASCRPYAP